MFHIEKYNQLVLDYIEAIQKPQIMAKLGLSFEKNVNDLFPDDNFLYDLIEKDLETEFGEDYDNRFELEAILKGAVTEEVINRTRFESPQHKSILNETELSFRKYVDPRFSSKVPYNATLHTNEADAEIKDYPDLDRPIIFFHGGLFSANLMFSKLYVQMITISKPDNIEKSIIPYYVKNDPENMAVIRLLAIYFHNYHFSSISKSERSYTLKTEFEKSLLSIFLESIELFIYSHEAGHAFFGHYKNIENKTVEEIWRDEFEADRFAMEAVLDLYNNKEDTIILTLLGPIIFFKYRFLLEKYKPEIGAKITHPPTMERMAQYYNWLSKVVRPEDAEILLAVLKLEQNVSLILLDLFEEIHKVAKQQVW